VSESWHTFSITQAKGGPLPTVINVESSDVELIGKFQPDPPPEKTTNAAFEGVTIEEHRGIVQWTAPIKVKSGVKPDAANIKVIIDSQACTDPPLPGRCVNLNPELTPTFAGFVDSLPELPQTDSSGAARSLPVENTPPSVEQVPENATPGEINTAPRAEQKGAPTESVGVDEKSDTSKVQTTIPITPVMLAFYVGLGLIGGLILNLMPCVLPVVGLKVLALAEQAHMHRGEVLKLNLWFSAGLISVFMLLAVFASVFTLSWGEQFTDTTFKVVITSVVFAMALSFLGVWEIPIPGFVGRGVSNDLQQKEGAVGAFFKGVFTTILSTPCSGPALGAVFAVILGQPPYFVYLLFFSIGLGMALPYLLIGLFPALIRFLPKPGAWMDTFKQLMGFVLLLTVAFLLSALPRYLISTFTLLIGVWIACWLIGRVPITASGNRKVRAWLGGATVIAATALMSFSDYFLLIANSRNPELELIDWVEYSPKNLDQSLASGKTVMVEFTAQWCLTCKLNLLTAINRKEVADLVEANDVMPLLADWTDKNSTIKQGLNDLNSNSIPLLAIYPAGKGKDGVIILRDAITKNQLLEALAKAGPSQTAPQTETAMTTGTDKARGRN
jgi:thiol:disulfide interchange protein